MRTIQRTLRARLPNGTVVAVQPHTELESNPKGEEAAHLAYLLDNPDTRENDLLDFLTTVAPILFPETDPSQRPKPLLGSMEWGVDLMFELHEHPAIGIVEIKTHRSNVRRRRKITQSVAKALKQVTHFLERPPSEQPIKIAYIIAGRRGTVKEIENGYAQQSNAPVPIKLWTWDDVAERLTSNSDGDEPAFEVVLIEITELSRRLLRALLREPNLLSGIDDRKFEELVATLLFDLGLQDVELTPLRKDKGRDIIAHYDDPVTGRRCTYLIECKHWVSGTKVTMRWALSLMDIVNRERATGAVLLSSSGFGPRLLEQEASLEIRNLMLRDTRDLHRWLHVWERQYGSVLVQPVNPMAIFAREKDDF